MATIQLYLLGPAEFQYNHQPVKLTQAKGIALLAYLAVNQAPQTRAHLMDLLWPNSLPQAARRNLRNTLWAVREGVSDDIFWSEGERLALAEAVWVDIHAFEAVSLETAGIADLEAAITQHRAPLLDGLTLTEAPDFELWLTVERERLGRRYLRLLDRLAAIHRAAADWPAMIAVAHQALASDDLQEPMYRALMEAYARLGQRQQALRQYALLETVLERELGVEPLPETQAVYQAVLKGQPLRPLESPPVSPPRPPRPPRRQTPPPLIGRQAERAVLNEAMQRARGGQAQVVLLSGELGIGKTHLWQAWSAALPNDVVVLETYCLMNTGWPALFGPLHHLLSHTACAEIILKPSSPLPDIWLAELSHFLPEIRRRRPDLPPPLALPSHEKQARLFEALTQMFQLLAGSHLILFIDDLHWADSGTLSWLVYFVDRMRQSPLLLVCAYRPTETPDPVQAVIAGWRRYDWLQQITLPHLTAAEAKALLSARRQELDAGAIRRLQKQSGGNPYFLLELSQAPAGEIPTDLADLLHTRLRQTLPACAYQLLQVAAVLLDKFDFETLRRTAGRGEEETLDALDALLAATVLVEHKDGYSFTHPLVAAVMQANLSRARRKFLHRRAAAALRLTQVEHPGPIACRLATHYFEAGDLSQAAAYTELAADYAFKFGAGTEAMALYRQALAWEVTPERQLGLAQVLTMQGDLAGAQEMFQVALVGFEQQQRGEGIARVSLSGVLCHVTAGRHRQAQWWLERGRQAGETYPLPPDLETELHFWAASLARLDRRFDEAEFHLGRATELAHSHNLVRLTAQGRFEEGNLRADRGDLPAAITAFSESLRLAQETSNWVQEALSYNNLAYHELLAGELAAAQEHIEAGFTVAKRYALAPAWPYLYSTRGEIALALGRFDEAESHFARALEEAEQWGNESHQATIRANQERLAEARSDVN